MVFGEKFLMGRIWGESSRVWDFFRLIGGKVTGQSFRNLMVSLKLPSFTWMGAWPYYAVCASRHCSWWKQARLTPLSCSTFHLSSINQSCQTYLLGICRVQPLLITATIIISVKFAIISHLDFFFLTFDFVSPLVATLVPWPGVEPVPSAVKVWSPNYWTTREFSLTQTLVMSPFFLLTPV